MSRDFTPRELYYADKYMGGHLAKSAITWTSSVGEEVVTHDPNSETAKQYPNMYFLCQEVLEDAIESKVPSERLLEIEKTLKDVIEKDEREIDTKIWRSQKNIEEPLGTVTKWYYGELDSNFYYNNRNNGVFSEFIKNGEWGEKGKSVEAWKPKQDKLEDGKSVKNKNAEVDR